MGHEITILKQITLQDWKREIKKENCLHLICAPDAKKAKEKLKAHALEILTLSSKSMMSQRDLKRLAIKQKLIIKQIN